MPNHAATDGQATPTHSLVPTHTEVVTASPKSHPPSSPQKTADMPQTTEFSINPHISTPIGFTERAVPHGGTTVEPRLENTVKRGFWSPQRRSAALCLALAVGITAVLIPAVYTVRHAVLNTAGGSVGRYLGQVLGAILPTEGLPPTGPLFNLGDPTQTTVDSEDITTENPPSDTQASMDSAALPPADTRHPDESTAVTEPPSEGDTTPEITPPADSVQEPDSTPAEPNESDSTPTEGTGEPPSSDTSERPGDTTSQPSDDDASSAESTPSDAPMETEKDAVGTDKSDETDEPVTTPASPVGCYPIVSLDLSESDRGAGYLHSEIGTLPGALPTEPLWRQGMPAVLILHTHPYEGYSDGDSYYDPAQGSLAVTDSPNDPDGVVALGIRLTRALRGQGITVIHLRVAVTSDETADAIYARTAALVRYYCRLYPDIGLILDLRRSAELTAEGGVLQTAGTLRGESVAQLRMTVSGGRPTEAVARDLEAALTIRAHLWAQSPSLSRPVRVRDGDGLIGDADLDSRQTAAVGTSSEASAPVFLTVEFGSAGNTFAEAAALVAPMAAAIGELLLSETEGL